MPCPGSEQHNNNNNVKMSKKLEASCFKKYLGNAVILSDYREGRTGDREGGRKGDLTRFNKIAIQGTPQMAVESLSFDSKCTCPYFMCNPP